MRKTILALVLASSVFGATKAHAQETLQLEQAIRIALENNERAQKAHLRVEVAAGSLDKARTAFYPTLSAGGSGAYALQADKTGRNWTESGTVTLNQPLFNPSAIPQYRQSAHSLESERWGGLQDRRQLAFDTARAFFTALANEQVYQSSLKKLQQAKDNLAASEAQVAAGLVSINDATRATISLSSSALAVSTAEGRLATSYLALSFLLNRQIKPAAVGEGSPLAPAEKAISQAASFDTRADDQVKTALERRADLRSSHEKTLSLKASAEEPYWRMAPSASVSGTMRLIPDPIPTEQAHTETITFNLSWTIFDAGARYADLRTRKAQLYSQELDENLLKRQVDNDIRTALASLRAAREGFRVADEAIAPANRGVDETTLLYKQGLATALERDDATQTAYQAAVTRESAKLTMEQAYLDLRFALGLGPIDDTEPAK